VAKIVGELGVEITADSNGLAEEIRTKVEAAVREAATEQLALSVDTAALARKLQDAIKAAKATAGNIKIGVELVDTGFIAAVEAEVQKATAVAGDVKFGVELGVASVDQEQLAAGVRASLAKAQAEIPALKLKLELDDDGLLKSVQVAVAKVKAEVSKIKLGFDVDTASLAAKVKAAAKIIEEETKIEPKIDPKTAKADFETFAKDLTSRLTSLQGTFNGFASSFFSSVFQAAKWSSIIVGAAQAGVSVIQLSGALGVIPGAVLAGVSAIAALKIGTEGFGQAVKDIGTDKFAADVAKLAPAARDTANAVAGIKPSLDQLKLDVQQRLFEGLGSSVRSLATTLLPVLNTGLTGMAATLNEGAKSVVIFFSAATVRNDLALALEAARTGTGNLLAALPAVLSIFRDLGTVGAQAFASVTGGAASATQRLADFIARSRESGSLANFIDGGVAAFRQLAQIVGNVLVILDDLFGALGGGGILGLLVQLTSTLKDFLNSAAGNDAIAALGEAMSQIAASAGQVFLALLQAVGKVLADHAPDIAAFAQAIGNDLVSAINTLAPVLSGLLSVIGANPELFANIAIGAIALAGALNVLVPIATTVAALVALGIPGLVVAIIAAVVAAVVLVILNFDKIKAAIGVALDAIGQFFVFLGTTIANAFGNSVAFVESIWNNVVSFFVGIGTAIGSAVSTAVDAVGGFFSDGFNAVVGFVAGVISSIVNYFVALPGQVAATIAGIPAAFVAMTDQLAFAVGFGIGAVFRFFADLPNNVITAVGQLVIDLVTWGNNVGISMATAISAAVDNTIAFFTALPGRAVAAVSQLIIDVATWANQVGISMATAINNAVNNTVNFFTALPGRVIGAVNALIVEVAVWANNVGISMATAINNGINNVVNFARNFPGQFISAIGDLASRLYQVGVNALTGLLNGLKSIAQSIMNWVSGLVSNILGGFSAGFDSHSPSRETYKIGTFVGEGLANGLRDSMQLVGDAATSLAQAGLDALDPILNPTVDTTSVVNSLTSAAGQLSGNPGSGVNYTVQQTNVMQQGTDVNQFADAVLKNGAAALASSTSLLGVSQLGVQAGINPNFLAVSGV
jgi:phage-related protein